MVAYPTWAVSDRSVAPHLAPRAGAARAGPRHRQRAIATQASGRPTTAVEGQIQPGQCQRTVLMVLFHFPPLGGVAISRNVRNVQYLPRYGWTPVVIAPRDASGLMDPGSVKLVAPGTRVIRAWCLEPRHLRRVLVGLRGSIRSAGRPGHAATTSTPHPEQGAVAASVTGRSVAVPAPPRLSRLLWPLLFPDNQIGWLPFALVAALRAHRSAPFDAVYSTAAPVTAHLVAGVFKRLTGVPWVAEFRDPWLGNPVTEAVAGPRSWVRRRLQARLERWIVHSADRVVFVSASTTHLYRRRYPDAAPMVTITNGIDRGDALVRAPASTGRLGYRIVWTGTLDRPEELRMFLEAVKALGTRRPDLVDKLEIDFYGDVSDACRAIADQFTADGLGGAIVRFPGFVPRRDALEALAGADAALIMLGAGPGMGQFVPGKLFEYLGQNRQLLAVLPPGDARDILEGLGWGVIAEPDVPAIERAIERVMSQPPPTGSADPEGRYDRVMLAGRLADAISEAAGSAGHARVVR